MIRTYIYADGDGGATVGEHLVVTSHQAGEAVVHRIDEGYTLLLRFQHEERNGFFKLNLFDVTPPVR